jgi:RNA polymerase sigma-70 factor (ECF subfamily)
MVTLDTHYPMLGNISNSSEVDESQLIQSAKAGDEQAFGKLYQRNLAAVYRFFYSRLDNPQDAEDLTEETFLRIWRSLPGYKDRGVPFLAYAYRIARNLLIDHYRRYDNSSKITQLQDGLEHRSQPDPGETAMDNLTHDEVRQALSHLGEDYQTVIVSRFLGELSTKEVAVLMDRSPGSVRALQHRALKALRTILQ